MRPLDLQQFRKKLFSLETLKTAPLNRENPSLNGASVPTLTAEPIPKPINKTVPDISRYTCRMAGEDDLEGIAQLFRSHNYGPQKVEWLRWKYLQNPDGRSKIFVGLDSDGSAVAIRVHLPRSFTSANTGTFLVNQSVDWFVAEKNRGTGVYAQVRELSRRTRNYPTIGFPNELSKSISRTFEGDKRTYFPIDEWWFPIAIGGLIQGKPYSFAGPCTDALSKAYSLYWVGKPPSNISIEPVVRFQKDYQMDPTFIHGVRSAEFLNWRFIDNPMRKFNALEFIRDTDSIGYCVFDTCNSFAKIYDLVLNHHPKECLRLLVDHCRERGMSHLIFKSVGFRMSRYGFIRIGSPGFLDTVNVPPGKWLVSFADKD